jgi:hypothetical protein
MVLSYIFYVYLCNKPIYQGIMKRWVWWHGNASNQYIFSEHLEVFGRHLIILLISSRNSLSETWNIFFNNKNSNEVHFMCYIIVIYLSCKSYWKWQFLIM